MVRRRGGRCVWSGGDHSVFAHRVVDVARAAGQRDLVLDDRVEAEENFLAVKDIELEQRRAGVGADLHVSSLDEAEVSELLHSVEDRMGVAGRQAVGAGAVFGVVGEVVGAAGPWGGWCRVAASESSEWRA